MKTLRVTDPLEEVGWYWMAIKLNLEMQVARLWKCELVCGLFYHTVSISEYLTPKWYDDV
jgi:hypothetical protein